MRYVRAQKWGGGRDLPLPPPWKVGASVPLAPPPFLRLCESRLKVRRQNKMWQGTVLEWVGLLINTSTEQICLLPIYPQSHKAAHPVTNRNSRPINSYCGRRELQRRRGSCHRPLWPRSLANTWPWVLLTIIKELLLWPDWGVLGVGARSMSQVYKSISQSLLPNSSVYIAAILRQGRERDYTATGERKRLYCDRGEKESVLACRKSNYFEI